MVGGGSIQLFRILGIRVGVHASWFLVLFLFIFLLSEQFQEVLEGSGTQAYVTAVAAVLALFGSRGLHELGPAAGGPRLGVPLAGIVPWFFGGVARRTPPHHSPGHEL